MELRPEELINDYYAPILELTRDPNLAIETLSHANRRYKVVFLEPLELTVGLDAALASAEDIAQVAQKIAQDSRRYSDEAVSIGSDGIYVRLGAAWSNAMMRLQPQLRRE